MIKELTVYADLIKYKLSLAVVFSSVTGYFLSSNILNHSLLFLGTGVFMLASGSAALNQYTERATDSIMDRTKTRPIPSKKISENKALIISLSLFMGGSILLYFNGIVPLFLGLLSIVMYNLIYTYLNKISVFSIIPGALVGALPPMIGFTSAGGELNQPVIIAFSSFIFLWQLPHFWLIIIKYGKEYEKAGFATITHYLNEIQIRNLVFFWVLFSSVIMLVAVRLADLFSRNLSFMFVMINLVFILLFYKMLFRKRGSTEIKGAFIMINLISLTIMFLIITISVLKAH